MLRERAWDAQLCQAPRRGCTPFTRLKRQRLRHLELHPGHAFAQTGEHRFAFGRENTVVHELVFEDAIRRIVAELDRAIKAAGRLMRHHRHRPISVADVTRKCQESLLIFQAARSRTASRKRSWPLAAS